MYIKNESNFKSKSHWYTQTNKMKITKSDEIIVYQMPKSKCITIKSDENNIK